MIPKLKPAISYNGGNKYKTPVIELGFENKRWQDLIRTGQALSVMNAYGVDLKTKFGYLLPQSYNVIQSRLLFAIPLREIQLNSKLVQNPGY